MFNFFKAIGHFFTSLFGGAGHVVQTVLHDVSSFVNLAAPIVQDLATIAQAQPNQTGLIADIERWIADYQADAAKISAWVTQAQTMPYLDVLRSAAVFALSAIVPAGTAQSLLNLAVELAYSVFKQKTAS